MDIMILRVIVVFIETVIWILYYELGLTNIMSYGSIFNSQFLIPNLKFNYSIPLLASSSRS